MKRSQIVSIILKSTEDPLEFLKLIEKHKNSADTFDITEFLQVLPKKEHFGVWKSIASLAEVTLVSLANTDGDTSTADQVVSDLSKLNGVVEFISVALALDELHCPEIIKEVLQQLHDVFLTVMEITPDLQNRACSLLECWWNGEKEGREGLIPNSLLYLLARTLNEGAKVADVKRVWGMRKALLFLDFEDPLTNPFKTMLLACIIQEVYLKSSEGRKFLSFLFGMHPNFVEDLHQTFKNQIPFSTKALLEIYAEIYFRAWRLASGPYLLQLEEHCLQDLMYCAVHAPRAGVRSLFHSLRKFLSFIHGQHAQKGVSKMLLRLYSPFLWRSLKVAHPHVRANAAWLLLDAFPLQDPDSGCEQINDILQKQFDAMVDLLVDPCVLVRVTAVTGTCRILSLYFDLVPFPMMKELLGKLVKELVWDAAAIDVRVAVLQGLCVVLENRLSHPLLKKLLPLLHPLLHDNSEKVRLSFLELLLLVKGMRTVNFWHICSLEHLLARMEMDSVHVVKKIVALLADAFKPSASQTVQRCVSLLRLNPGACRRFYQLACTHLPPADVVRLILAIQDALLQCVKEGGGLYSQATPTTLSNDGDIPGQRANRTPTRWKQLSPPLDDEGTSLRGEEEAFQGRKEEENTESEGEEMESLSIDRSVVCGLVEVMVVLWEVMEDVLQMKSHSKLRQKVVAITEQNLPLLFDAFSDGLTRSNLYLLASHLPETSCQSMSRMALTFLSSSSSLRLISKTHDYTPFLVALVSWQRTSDLIRLVKEWLTPSLGLADDVATEMNLDTATRKKKTFISFLFGMDLRADSSSILQTTRRTGGKGRGTESGGTSKVKNATPSSSPQPMFALSMLSWMMVHPLCMQALGKTEEFWELEGLLEHSMDLLEKHFLSTVPLPGGVIFDLLRQSLSLYLRLCMHWRTSGEEGQGVWFRDEMKRVLGWYERILVPVLSDKIFSSISVPKPTRRSKRKRKNNQSGCSLSSSPSHLTSRVEAELLAKEVLGLLSDMLLVGLTGDLQLEMDIAQLGSVLANTDSGLTLLPDLCKLLYQLCAASSSHNVEVVGIAAGTITLTPTASLLSSLLSLLHSVSSEKPPATFNKAWGCMRQCVTVTAVASLRASALSITPHTLLTYTAFVRCTLHTQQQHIRMNTGLSTPSTIDDLPPFVGCILKQVCRDKQSTRFFGLHLHDYLCDARFSPDLSEQLLTHQASLHLLHVLSRERCGGKEEFVKCVRCSLTFLDGLSVEHLEEWRDSVGELRQQIEALQERICE